MDELERLRSEIIEVTKEILRLSAKRCRIAEEIGKIKKISGAGIVDKAAEERLIRECLEECRALEMRENFCRKLLRLLIDEAIWVQRSAMERD